MRLERFARPETLLPDLLAGVGCGLALLLLWWAAERWWRPARRLSALLGTLLAGLDRQQRIVLALLSGFAEELFFRGALQSALGLAWATALFALVHTGPQRATWPWTLFAALAGLGFGLLVLWHGTLLPAIVAHVLVNAIQLWRLPEIADAAAGGDVDALLQ